MKKLGRLELHNFEEICVAEQKSMKGGEWVTGDDGNRYWYVGEVEVVAMKNEPFNLWGPGSVFGRDTYGDEPYFFRRYWDTWGSSEPNNSYDFGSGGVSSGDTARYGYDGTPIYAAYGTTSYAIALALTYEGKIEEINGQEDNPTIIGFLNDAGINADNTHDEIKWCAAFVNFILKYSGLDYANSASIVTWKSWGYETSSPQAGDVYFSLEGGHVGLVIGVDGDRVTVISGNSNTGGSAGTVHSYTTSLDSFTYRTSGNGN